MIYQSKISSKMIINHKTGDASLEELDINVNGYKDRKRLKEAKETYNKDKEMKEELEGRDDWPIGMWYYLFGRYYRNIKRFKKIKK